MKKILVLLGHPDSETFCGNLATSYADGARKSGNEVREVKISQLNFDPILHRGYKEIQELEPDLKKLQEDIKWADHLVIVYPMWWGSFPALFKGLIDRIFLPGFGFKYHKDSPLWDRLLKGRTARLIITMDGPALFDDFVLCQASIKIVKRGVLQFCGIAPTRVTRIAKVKHRTEENLKKIINKVYKLGLKAK